MSAIAVQPAVIDINLLPVAHRPAQVSGISLFLAAILAVSVIAMIPLAFRLEAARAAAADAQRLAADAGVDLGALEAELARQRALRLETEGAQAELDVLVAKRELFQGGTRNLADDLVWLFGFDFLPPGARITTVAPAETGFRVDGVASGPLDGIAFAEKLVEAGGFESARMTSFIPGDRSGGQFSIEVIR